MPGGLGGVNRMSQEEEWEKDLKMSKYIKDMDEQVRDRFKALKVIQDYIRELDEEDQKQTRELEVEFENKYKEIYRLREALINGKSDVNATLVKEFDQRAAQMKDEDYDKLEVVPCDVKSI